MQFDTDLARRSLKAFDFKMLFAEVLGWERHNQRLDVPVDGQVYTLTAIAQKRGLVAFVCSPSRDGRVPDYPTRRKIDAQVAKSAREHLIVYDDADQTCQVWQWVKRELGKPIASREHEFRSRQTGEALIQKLRAIAFSLEEEESLTLPDVTGRARAAFDVERVTRRFYDRFKAEHAVFLKFVQGIEAEGDREWYASVMLNRLMFVYFIQKKGFLDGDINYLRNKLQVMQALKGKGQFLSFYRHFLLRLFHEGLGQQIRPAELDALLGNVPYLNGGLFDVHLLERDYPDIQIEDEAFERIFDFFDAYQWHLDERPLRADNEINPDVLGYIFEKYVNQKQMGAYYTKEDITEYISKNTIIPFLFDATREKCKIAFEGEHSVWRLLQADPDRYIYEAVRKAVELPLPAEIAAGLDEVARRTEWNKPAREEYVLPTEIWREVVARRRRYEDVRSRLAAGEVRSIDDFITYNLNIRQLAQDVIEDCEGPDLLRAFYHAIERVTVLDPTCGSGAFLFAALNILEPLYEACLQRMDAFVGDLERSGEKHRPEKFGDFRKILERVARHPNHRYFILKSIIVDNLYGVDIMEEAVEICKLRLFLKLVAQVDRVEDIEPLPDVDFNVRAGNTLVGFTSYEQVKNAVQGQLQGKLDFGGDMQRIDESAEIADRAFQRFHAMQTEHDMDASAFADAKLELRGRLDTLARQLDGYLASEYGIDRANIPQARQYEKQFSQWRASHQPFHWFAEFYGIMKKGGFDVIIGNPPWKEYSAVRRSYSVRDYASEACGNLHGICTERALGLRSERGRLSFIVQLPLTSSSRMRVVRDLLRQRSSSLFVISFDDRPGKLFEGLQHCRSVIFVSTAGETRDVGGVATTRYHRWATHAREHLFAQLEYVWTPDDPINSGLFPKHAGTRAKSVFGKVRLAGTETIGAALSRRVTDHFIFYQEATQYWVKATVGLPYYAKNGIVGAPPHGRFLYFDSVKALHSVCAFLHSSLFYAYFIAYGDCFHLSDTLVSRFPVVLGSLWDSTLFELCSSLMADMRANAVRETIRTSDGNEIAYEEFYGSKSKPIIDEIDRVLARYYGFTDEELDFIINYDIKYRMGLGSQEETGEER